MVERNRTSQCRGSVPKTNPFAIFFGLWSNLNMSSEEWSSCSGPGVGSRLELPSPFPGGHLFRLCGSCKDSSAYPSMAVSVKMRFGSSILEIFEAQNQLRR